MNLITVGRVQVSPPLNLSLPPPKILEPKAITKMTFYGPPKRKSTLNHHMVRYLSRVRELSEMNLLIIQLVNQNEKYLKT